MYLIFHLFDQGVQTMCIYFNLSEYDFKRGCIHHRDEMSTDMIRDPHDPTTYHDLENLHLAYWQYW